jgi:hypothetical protein
VRPLSFMRFDMLDAPLDFAPPDKLIAGRTLQCKTKQM